MDEALSQADDHNYAVAKRTMGEIFYLQGAYDNAISYLTDALKVFKSSTLPMKRLKLFWL